MSQAEPPALLACPNPLCDQTFATNELVCNHLVEPGTYCSRWSNDFVKNFIYSQDRERDVDDDTSDLEPEDSDTDGT